MLLAAGLVGCVTPPAVAPEPPLVLKPTAPAAPAPAAAVAELPPTKAEQAAESALSQGVKSYQTGQYPQAEAQLKAALKEGALGPADLASAHKYLAFIYCTSKREGLCAAAFKAARAADPSFALSKAESGHPMWARTYKKALGLK